MSLCLGDERPGTYFDPPEPCLDEALEGGDFCVRHDPDIQEDNSPRRRP